jgi:hypothetical protein
MPNHDVCALSAGEGRVSTVAEVNDHVTRDSGIETQRADPRVRRALLDRQLEPIPAFQAPFVEEAREPSKQRVAVLPVDSLALEDPVDGVALLGRHFDRSQLGSSRNRDGRGLERRGESDSETAARDQPPREASD